MITFYPRPNTQDSFIIKEVYEDNCYNLPPNMSNIVVIDIGANIGSFTLSCVDRNVKKVMAYEPNIDNFRLLFQHINQIENWGSKIEVYNGAVCSKPGHAFVSNANYLGDIKLTGGIISTSELNGGDYQVRCDTLDNILSGSFIKDEIWIKLDCEGAEHEIIQSIIDVDEQRDYKVLNFYHVTKIFGEVHTTIDGKICSIGPEVNFSLPSIEDFKLKLQQLGFTVTLKPHEIDPHLALFWAEKG